MGDKRFDDSATIGYFPRSTNDRGVEGFSGLMDNRGLFERKPDNSEVVSSIFRGDKIIGCSKLPDFQPQSPDLSRQEIKSIKEFASLYGYPGFQGTACLFIIADVVWGNIGSVYRKDLPAYFDFIERLIDIREVLEKRTKAPYRLWGDTENRKPLPAAILNYRPFSEYNKWKEILSIRKNIISGKWVILEPIPLKDKEEPKQPDKAQEELDKKLKKLEEKIIDAQLLFIKTGDSPIVDQAIGNLSLLTLENISRQTSVKFHTPFSDRKLIDFTELIIYHSVYSVVLNKTGDPIVIGDLDYPILVPPLRSVMERNIPPPPGLYISVAKYGDVNFIINGGQVKKMLFGGIGGFVENSGGGIRGPHEFQKTIQAYLDGLGGLAYVAAVSVKSAVDRNSISVDSVKEKVPEVISASLPYTFKEVEKRLEGMIEDYQSFIQQIGEGIIRTLIIEKIRNMSIEFLVKKIGAKLIPLINAVSAAYDAFTGEEEREQVRHAIAYMILAIKGKEKDDMTIAAKGLSKIMADKIQDRIIAELTNRGAKRLKQVIGHKKPVSKTAPQQQNLDQPSAKPNVPEADPRMTPTASPSTHSTPQKKPYDPFDAPLTAAEKAQIERMQAAKQKSAPEPEPEPSQQGKSTRKTDGKATDNKAVDSKGTGQPTVIRRSKEEAELRKSKLSSTEQGSEKGTESETDIEDTHRELTNRGNHDRHTYPGVDDIRRYRHIRKFGEGEADPGVLRKNMKAAKREFPGPGYEAHHIVPGNEPGAAKVKEILQEKGIGINEEVNGVYLARDRAGNVLGTYKHEFTFQHHPEYFTLLNGLIKRTDGADTIRKKIRILGGFLENGKLPTYIEVMSELQGKK